MKQDLGKKFSPSAMFEMGAEKFFAATGPDRHRHAFIALFAVLLVMALIASVQAQSLTWLGTFTGGGYSQAYDVSSSGNYVVGRAFNSSGQLRGVRWDVHSGQIEDLGTLGGPESWAWGTSWDGRFAAGWAKNSSGFIWRAFRWDAQNNVMKDLGTFGGDYSYAYDVSLDGRWVVGKAYDSNGQLRAFLWDAQNPVLQDLGTLGGNESEAYAIAEHGRYVVGRSQVAGGSAHAFLWDADTGTMQDLGTLGGTESEAWGVSAGGQFVVGWSFTSGGQKHAFLWSAETGIMQDLGTLGGSESWAYAVSADGRFVVGFAQDNTGQRKAFHWDAQTGAMEDLSVTYASLLSAGSFLEEAFAMSSDGRFIVGAGHNAATGKQEGYLLDTWELAPIIAWSGEGDGMSFSDPMNWLGNQVPGAGDIARFYYASETTQVQLSQPVTNTGLAVERSMQLDLQTNLYSLGGSCCPALQVNGPAGLTVKNGSVQVTQGEVRLGPVARPQLYLQSGGVLEMSGAGILTIAGTDTAELGILAGGTLSMPDGNLVIGEGAFPGRLWIQSSPDSVALKSQTIVAGAGQEGSLTVLAGRVISDTLWIGEGPGSSGSVSVGAASRLTGLVMEVGKGGTGLAEVDSTGLILTNQLEVGSQGMVRGPVLVLAGTDTTGTPGLPDSIGFWTADLTLRDGAVLDVDSLIFLPGGQLRGSGVFPLDLVNRGLVAPGDSGGVAGTLTVQGNFTQTAGGVLEIELGTPGDLLVVNGSAHFDGTLRIGLTSGFLPQAGDTFLVITYGGQGSGVFSQVEFPAGFSGSIGYSAGRVEVLITSPTGIGDPESGVPTTLQLQQNYPNPFNPSTRIEYRLPESRHVRLQIFDVQGRLVRELVNAQQKPGYYQVIWDGTNDAGAPVASGVYLYRLQAENYSAVRKMLLVR